MTKSPHLLTLTIDGEEVQFHRSARPGWDTAIYQHPGLTGVDSTIYMRFSAPLKSGPWTAYRSMSTEPYAVGATLEEAFRNARAKYVAFLKERGVL